MSTSPFVHLHCHSHYSLLDGASRLEDLVARAKELGMNALALTDHGNLHGALQFYQQARDAGIKPILGYEAYVAPGSRFRKEASGMKDAAFHLTLLAQNQQGFKNLMKLASSAFLEGFYYKPRIDRELLAEWNDGIICLSGCVSGELSQALLKGNDPEYKQAVEIAKWFEKVFGSRFFLEVQNNGVKIQQEAMAGTLEVAKRIGVPVVATSDAHYVRREDAEAQDVLLCINTGKYRTDVNRMRMETSEFFLRSPQEMYRAFPGHEEAVRRSQEIADSVDIELQLGKRHFPTFKVPAEKSAAECLEELCWTGLKERYHNNPEMCPNGELSEQVKQRLERELYVINKLGFANYFLIVWDFVDFAKKHNIQATARGSGVGALVSYALYLSHVCPLKYDLLFERFLDIERKEAPDIDIDFEKERRGEVIQYVKEKYGDANVAQIGTFGTLAARAAIRDVGRALNMPIPRVDQIVAMVPDKLGIELQEALDTSPELKQTYESDSQIRELLDLAKKIEGLARNVGTHAAAVVIADRPLTEYVPLQQVSGKDDVITQWSMEDVERAGLLKMDFLGLRNLTVLSKAVELIQLNRNETVDPYAFPLEDKKTYELLCRGETKGVFQLESGGIRDLLQRMKPDQFHDIIATNALYRPGPLEGGMVDDYIAVKHGRQQPVYKHPVMKDVLAETNGVMVYQEQVMRILNRLGGIELPNAYKCIKAISKKKLETIAKFQKEFKSGAQQQGLAGDEADEIFNLIEKFAGYGFNKSHSTAYALIAYMTAYLKAHYPVEFMAALLTSEMANRNFKKKDLVVEHIEDCRRMQIEVVPPDVNRSYPNFTVKGEQILFGLAAIKGCGYSAAEALAAERDARGPYTSLFDFCERLDPGVANRGTMEALVKAGAFDATGARRAALMQILERAIQSGAAASADRRAGQQNLFADADEDGPATANSAPNLGLPDVPEWPEKERLAHEKEVLGFYFSSHPLAEFEDVLKTFCSHRAGEVANLPDKTPVLLGGMLAAIKITHTKKPKSENAPTKYAMFDLEDLEGILRCILWPEPYAQTGHLVQADAIVAVRGRIDKRPGSEEVNIIVDEIIPLTELEARYTKKVVIRVPEDETSDRKLDSLFEILRGYPGECELQLLLQLLDGSRFLLSCDALKISLNPVMRQRVEELLGSGQLKLVAAKFDGRQNGNGSGRNGHGPANGFHGRRREPRE